jgi:hypothetical protein
MKQVEAWHFSVGRLGFDRKGTLVVPGLTLGDDRREIYPCKKSGCARGLSASRQPLDALCYAPYADPYTGSLVVSRVELRGRIIDNGDKLTASWRRHVWCAPCDDTLHAFARACALDVVHLWDCPAIVMEYLQTGKEELRVAAWAVAWVAAQAAGRAAQEATTEAQNKRLHAMLMELAP